MQTFYEEVAQTLGQGESIVMASVIAKHGSAPRGPGSKMLIFADGATSGTVGGGRVEALVTECGREMFESKTSCIKDFALNAGDVADVGMICGGDVTIFVQYLDGADPANAVTFGAAAAQQQKSGPAWMVTRVDTQGTHQSFLHATDVHDSSPLPPAVARQCGTRNTVVEHEGERYIIERICGLDKAFIFGCGHVGAALAPVLAGLGFTTTMVDDREDFCCPEAHPAAQEHVLGFGEDVIGALPFDARSYIIIVTRGHLADENVLRAVLKHAPGAPYVGMIGSRTKRNAIYDHLLAEGLSYGVLNRVHCPIGLDIGAQTPEEIAVCIAAEIIAARAKQNG